MYSVGDKVVCAHHGAGKVVRIEQKEALGRRREYLTIEISHNHMTVMIPVDNAGRTRLRKVIAADAVDGVLEVLRGDSVDMPQRWHARSKRIQEKLGTGDIVMVAEVIRDLVAKRARRDLPLGEKQTLARAEKILVSELMYARDVSTEDAVALLENALGDARVDAAGRAPGAARLA